MLDFGIDEHEFVAVGLEWEIFKFHGTAVETHQIVLLAEDRCKLVHDAAVHAAIVVFGRLTDAGELEFVDGVAVEQIVEGKSKAALECG